MQLYNEIIRPIKLYTKLGNIGANIQNTKKRVQEVKNKKLNEQGK